MLFPKRFSLDSLVISVLQSRGHCWEQALSVLDLMRTDRLKEDFLPNFIRGYQLFGYLH